MELGQDLIGSEELIPLLPSSPTTPLPHLPSSPFTSLLPSSPFTSLLASSPFTSLLPSSPIASLLSPSPVTSLPHLASSHTSSHSPPHLPPSTIASYPHLSTSPNLPHITAGRQSPGKAEAGFDICIIPFCSTEVMLDGKICEPAGYAACTDPPASSPSTITAPSYYPPTPSPSTIIVAPPSSSSSSYYPPTPSPSLLSEVGVGGFSSGDQLLVSPATPSQLQCEIPGAQPQPQMLPHPCPVFSPWRTPHRRYKSSSTTTTTTTTATTIHTKNSPVILSGNKRPRLSASPYAHPLAASSPVLPASAVGRNNQSAVRITATTSDMLSPMGLNLPPSTTTTMMMMTDDDLAAVGGGDGGVGHSSSFFASFDPSGLLLSPPDSDLVAATPPPPPPASTTMTITTSSRGQHHYEDRSWLGTMLLLRSPNLCSGRDSPAAGGGMVNLSHQNDVFDDGNDPGSRELGGPAAADAVVNSLDDSCGTNRCVNPEKVGVGGGSSSRGGDTLTDRCHLDYPGHQLAASIVNPFYLHHNHNHHQQQYLQYLLKQKDQRDQQQKKQQRQVKAQKQQQRKRNLLPLGPNLTSRPPPGVLRKALESSLPLIDAPTATALESQGLLAIKGLHGGGSNDLHAGQHSLFAPVTGHQVGLHHQPLSSRPLVLPQSHLPQVPPETLQYPPMTSRLRSMRTNLQPMASPIQPMLPHLQPMASPIQPMPPHLQPMASPIQPMMSSIQPAGAPLSWQLPPAKAVERSWADLYPLVGNVKKEVKEEVVGEVKQEVIEEHVVKQEVIEEQEEVEEAPSFACTGCRKTFPSHAKLSSHFRTSHKIYDCELCQMPITGYCRIKGHWERCHPQFGRQEFLRCQKQANLILNSQD